MKKLTKKLVTGTLVATSVLSLTACTPKKTDTWSVYNNFDAAVYGPPPQFEEAPAPAPAEAGAQDGDASPLSPS